MAQVTCPKCGSESIHAGKKGFSGKKAIVGGLLTGGIGVVAGALGSNTIVLTCLSCGNNFKPGDSAKAKSGKSFFSPESMVEVKLKQAKAAAKARTAKLENASTKVAKPPTGFFAKILFFVGTALTSVYAIGTIYFLVIGFPERAVVGLIPTSLFLFMAVYNYKKFQRVRVMLNDNNQQMRDPKVV